MMAPPGLLPLDETRGDVLSGTSGGVIAGQVLSRVIPGSEGWYWVTGAAFAGLGATVQNLVIMCGTRRVGLVSSQVTPIEFGYWVKVRTGELLEVRAVAAQAVVVYTVSGFAATLYRKVDC